MDFATRKRYYNRCKPNEPLAPDDDRNVDLDRFEGARVRGLNWVDRFASRIELSDGPVLKLFTGLPGSGKSTELRRLASRLSLRDRAYLLPVLIDAEEVIDLANPVDIPDILAAILQKTEECVLRKEGRDPEQALEESYLTRFWNWLTRTDVELGKAEYAIPGGPKLVAEMKARPSLRERVRKTVAAHLTTFLREVREEMILLNGRAHVLGYSGLFVIFDSLEKLRGISTNWKDVLESAEQVFAANAPYLRLPVHVLYTVPAALAAHSRVELEFMPMIKLQTRDGSRYEAGMDAARELVRRRVPEGVLKELFGPDAEKRVEELILWSGGYPREIVRLLQESFALSEIPVSEEDLQRIWGEVCGAYRQMVPSEAFEWLVRVAVERFLTPENDAHRQAADRMLQNNVILRYLNDEPWYDLHPAIYEIPGVREAIKKCEAERAQSG